MIQQVGILARDALRDLAPFEQFKKHGKHPWRSASFSLQLYAKVTKFFQSYSSIGVFHVFYFVRRYQIGKSITKGNSSWISHSFPVSHRLFLMQQHLSLKDFSRHFEIYEKKVINTFYAIGLPPENRKSEVFRCF